MLIGVDDSLQTNLECGDQILKITKHEKVLGVTDNKLTLLRISLKMPTKSLMH